LSIKFSVGAVVVGWVGGWVDGWGRNICVVAEPAVSELPVHTKLNHMPATATLNNAQPIYIYLIIDHTLTFTLNKISISIMTWNKTSFPN
jgi:hypothetical protein